MPVNDLVSVKSNETIEQEKALDLSSTENASARESLASYIAGEWEKAKLNKRTKIEGQLLEALRRRNGEYSPLKLSQMKQLEGPDYDPIYVPLTGNKCQSAIAWLMDATFQPDNKPYSIEPTPIPEPNETEKQSLATNIINQEIQNAIQMSIQTGQEPDMQSIMAQVQRRFPEELEKEIKKRASELSEEITQIIDDQLVEGGWYQGVENIIADVVTFPAGIMKATFQKDRTPIRKTNPKTKKTSVVIEERIIRKWEVRSPFNIYPAADASDINDGDLIDLITLTPKELSQLKDMDGYDSDAIDRVLTNYRSGGLHEWTGIESERATQENKVAPQMWSTKVDCLNYWGTVPGRMLKDHGITKDENDKAINDLTYYDIEAYKIGSDIIKVCLNPDPLGRKPYYKASWTKIPGSWWGLGIPDILGDLQDACNALARAIVKNSAFAAIPQTEINEDRVDYTQSGSIWPGKIYRSTNQQMQESAAIRFTNVTMVADRLISVYNHFAQIADEVSVPAYAHGDTNVSGAGRTASGLSMLYGGASRNIKGVMRNIDAGVIDPSITDQYNCNIIYNLTTAELPDVRIVAKGSASIVLKDQMASRIANFMSLTNNPVDVPLTNRWELIREAAVAQGLDADKIMADVKRQEAGMGIPPPGNGMPSGGGMGQFAASNPTAFNAWTGGSMPKQPALDVAGNKANGVETRQFGNGENQ